MPFVSLVIPMLNESEGVGELLDRVQLASAKCESALEIIVVDDGSTDDTARVARAWFLAHEYRCWKIVRLTRNFGHQPAYLAGVQNATGEAVIMMDADLQDPPELIPELIQAWQGGAKLVNAVRLSRAETGWRKKCFDAFHYLFHRMTNGIMPSNSGNFGLMDRVIVDHMLKMPEGNLFLPALRSWVGYEKAEITYHRQPRLRGEAKMNWSRLVNLAWAGITSFSSVPLNLIGWLGVVVAIPSFLWAGLLVMQRILQCFGFFHELEVLGFTTVAVAVLALGSVQLICLGVIGEYLGRIYQEVKQRPRYLVREIIDSGTPETTGSR